MTLADLVEEMHQSSDADILIDWIEDHDEVLGQVRTAIAAYRDGLNQ